MEISIKDDKPKKERIVLIKPYKFVKIFLIILDIFIAFTVCFLTISFLLFSWFFNDSFQWWVFLQIFAFFILLLIVLHFLYFNQNILIIKNFSSQTILIQKKFISKQSPVLYDMNESPRIYIIRRLGGIPGFFELAIVSNKKRSLLRSYSWGYVSGWMYTKEDAQRIAKAINIKVSQQIGNASEIFKYIGK